MIKLFEEYKGVYFENKIFDKFEKFFLEIKEKEEDDFLVKRYEGEKIMTLISNGIFFKIDVSSIPEKLIFGSYIGHFNQPRKESGKLYEEYFTSKFEYYFNIIKKENSLSVIKFSNNFENFDKVDLNVEDFKIFADSKRFGL